MLIFKSMTFFIQLFTVKHKGKLTKPDKELTKILHKNGIKVNDIFKIVKEFKKFDKNKPVILMGYYNMIFQYGENKFLNK